MSQDPRGGAAGPPAHGRRSRPPQLGVVELLRGGDEEAMAAVFTEHLDVIYNYCYRRTSSWSAAEDLSATVFLEVWRHRQRAVELDGSVLPWLYGIATNVCRNHQRSRRRGAAAMGRLELVDDSTAGTSPPVEDEVVGRIDAGRRLRRALGALAELPVADQDVFVLVCWEQLSYPQAAHALGIPVGTVRSRLARVRRHLRLADDQSPTIPGTTTTTTAAAADRRPVQEGDHV